MPLEVVKNSFCRKLAMVFRKLCMKKTSLYLKKKIAHGRKQVGTNTKGLQDLLSGRKNI
jgi:hypothetical protein